MILLRPLLIVWALTCWGCVRIGYWLRPYDMVADRRRWRWQPRTRCGFSYGYHLPATPDPQEGTDGD